VRGPELHLREFSPGEITFADDSVLSTQPLLHVEAPDEVRLVRGTRCKTTKDLFDEFSAALQFPGENGARPVPIALVVVESADKIGVEEQRWLTI
jgi:hypothetical protein